MVLVKGNKDFLKRKPAQRHEEFLILIVFEEHGLLAIEQIPMSLEDELQSRNKSYVKIIKKTRPVKEYRGRVVTLHMADPYAHVIWDPGTLDFP